LSLEQAFYAHSSAFDLDGDGTICVEELIIIMDRCQLFDDFFTANRVRNYFNTWVEGCNVVNGAKMPFTEDGIGFKQFKEVLKWAADLKGLDMSSCAQKVVRLSRKLCDKSASVQRRLEAVFDAFCKKDPECMTAFEFGTLCSKIGVYEEDKFTMGDVYSLFYKINGVVHNKGIDFNGFTQVLTEIGKRLDIGEDVFAMFARGVELMDTDEETIIRVRMRLRHAAGIVGGTDWRQFFLDCDPDGNQVLDWDEFLTMCRDKLHLADRDNHLRILFDRLDEDGSGELDINELIQFISD
jgi:Ca2+-binding EF-hand superfamily protein